MLLVFAFENLKGIEILDMETKSNVIVVVVSSCANNTEVENINPNTGLEGDDNPRNRDSDVEQDCDVCSEYAHLREGVHDKEPFSGLHLPRDILHVDIVRVEVYLEGFEDSAYHPDN